jgi:hypothetical protein
VAEDSAVSGTGMKVSAPAAPEKSISAADAQIVILNIVSLINYLWRAEIESCSATVQSRMLEGSVY